MAKILENEKGRRMIRLSVDDIIMIIAQYQTLCKHRILKEEKARELLKKNFFYLPEEV